MKAPVSISTGGDQDAKGIREQGDGRVEFDSNDKRWWLRGYEASWLLGEC